MDEGAIHIARSLSHELIYLVNSGGLVGHYGRVPRGCSASQRRTSSLPLILFALVGCNADSDPECFSPFAFSEADESEAVSEDQGTFD